MGECYAAIGAEDVGLAEAMKAKLQQLENGPWRTTRFPAAADKHAREEDESKRRHAAAKVCHRDHPGTGMKHS